MPNDQSFDPLRTECSLEAGLLYCNNIQSERFHDSQIIDVNEMSLNTVRRLTDIAINENRYIQIGTITAARTRILY